MVDDCHSDLILKPSSQGTKQKQFRRSLSSTGINNGDLIAVIAERRQNSFETVINLSMGGGDSPLRTADMRHSTEALSSHQPPPVPAKRKCNELLAPGQKRHPLSHSQETVLYTDDGYDPQPILPNRQPGTPNVWVPITPKVVRA